MIGRVNTGGGTGGTLTVTAPANVTVTVSKDGKTKTKNSGTSGVVVFKGLASGTERPPKRMLWSQPIIPP